MVVTESFETDEPSDVLAGTATCPAGTLATGGGGSIEDASTGSVAISRSIPDGDPPTAWRVVTQATDTTGEDWSLTVYVVCAGDPVENTSSQD
jgi:hypothetical protein